MQPNISLLLHKGADTGLLPETQNSDPPAMRALHGTEKYRDIAACICPESTQDKGVGING